MSEEGTPAAARVLLAYAAGAPEGSLPPLVALGRVYPMFGLRSRDPSQRAADTVALAEGRLLDLGIGSYFPTHPRVVEAAREALARGVTQYLDSASLKEAVAAKYRDENGVDVDPQGQIVLLGGARPGIAVVMLALLETGDEVVVPDPDYIGLVHPAAALGARIVRVPMRRKADGSLEGDADALVSAISARTRLVALTNPGNPSGYVWGAEELRTVVETARRFRAFVLVNEVYDKLVWGGRNHTTALVHGSEGVVVVGGVSKSYDMTGFHVGWVVTASDWASVLADLRFLLHQAEAPAVSQVAATVALTAPVREEHPARSREILRANAEATARALGGLEGVRCPVAQAGQFAFPLVGGDDQVLAEALKERFGVCVVPGSVWGRQGRGHLRVALANDRALQAAGLERLRLGLEALLER